MGKGIYGGENSNESVMYWTTDHGFDVDISPFIKSENKERTEHGWMCHVWRATVTFGDYSYELATSHFNMNILADDIKAHLLSKNFPNFSYKIDGHNDITKQYYEEVRGKFGSSLERKDTRYNPVRNIYTTEYELRDDNWQVESKFSYIHRGNPDTHIKGDFFKEILKHCKKDRYPVNETQIPRHCKRELKDLFSLRWQKVEMKKTWYVISTDSYIQQMEFHDKFFEFPFIGDAYNKEMKTDVVKFISNKFPEYVL